MILALLLLFSATARVELIPGEIYEIPRNDWKYIPLDLKQRPARVDAAFRVENGSDHVRIALLTSEDLERMRQRDSYGVLALTDVGSAGRLQYQALQPGEYVIVIDNRSETVHAATVRLDVWLDFANATAGVTEISPARRLAVVSISCIVFFALVTFSARRLWRTVRH